MRTTSLNLKGLNNSRNRRNIPINLITTQLLLPYLIISLELAMFIDMKLYWIVSFLFPYSGRET
jgi:hypothetical protein